jgi:hypothetical protein
MQLEKEIVWAQEESIYLYLSNCVVKKA